MLLGRKEACGAKREREREWESEGFITSEPSTSSFFARAPAAGRPADCGLAPSQNAFEKLFVSNTPNKGIIVMLMTLWPITAPADGSVRT